MANTYKWDCRTVDAYPTHTDENGVTESQVVYNVHWRLTGFRDTHETTVVGTQVLSTDDLEGFTAFDSITHDDMIAWTQAALGEERLANLTAMVDKVLAEKVTPTSVSLRIVSEDEIVPE